jgi:hypothetical protein
MDINEILNETRANVNWYRKNNKKGTINEFMNCRTRIVTNNFLLSEQLGELKTDYNNCYFSRKIEISKSKNELIKNKHTATHAESEANIINEDILRQELDNESAAYRLELFIRHSDNVANDLMQRISVLKKEYENNKEL